MESIENINETITYFSDASMQAHISRAHENINRLIATTPNEHEGAEYHRALIFIGAALKEMMLVPAFFDSSCEFNIKSIGHKFSESVQGIGASEKYEIDTLLAVCYRMVVEFELKSSSSMSTGLSSAWNDVADLNFREFKVASSQIRWAKNHMAFLLLREYIHHPHMTSLKNLPTAIKTSEDARIKSDEELSKREERVNAIADKLKGYENAYNFVGLYQGFSNLKDDKVSERELTFKFLIFLGLCLIVVPLLKLLNVIGHNDDLVKEAFSVAALLALELMIIYFFRIALQNFRSAKAQLLQIDLRMTLCQFINSYVEFASDARKGDKELLQKFEQIIFSGIVTDESGIPSTFDGLDQVVKIAESFKPR